MVADEKSKNAQTQICPCGHGDEHDLRWCDGDGDDDDDVDDDDDDDDDNDAEFDDNITMTISCSLHTPPGDAFRWSYQFQACVKGLS